MTKNSKSSKKHRRATPAQAAAGRKNLLEFNAACGGRAALRHGIRALMKTGDVPDVPGAAAVVRSVDEIISQSIGDMGYSSEAELPAQRRAILASQKLALLVLGLASEFISREGLLNRRGRPHPLLSIVATFGNTVRLNGVALGLERKPRRVGPVTLEEYLDQKGGGTDSAAEAPKANGS